MNRDRALRLAALLCGVAFAAHAANPVNPTLQGLTVNGPAALNGKTTTAAPTTAQAGFNLPQGTAPSAPVNGDLWTTSAGLYVRILGTTVGPLGTGGGGGGSPGGNVNSIQYNAGNSLFGGISCSVSQMLVGQTSGAPLCVSLTGGAISATGVLTLAAASLTGATLPVGITGSSLTSVGTITSGTWHGGVVGVPYGGTGLSAGTSGGIPYFSSSSTMVSSAALTNNALIVGSASGPVSLGSLGTTTTVYHGNAGGVGSFGAVNLSSDVTGSLPFSNITALAANQILGALTATTPGGLSMPSCSTSSSALTWTSGAGFGCNSISGGGGSLTVQDTAGTPDVVTSVTTLTMGAGFQVSPASGTGTATVTPTQPYSNQSGSVTISGGTYNGAIVNMSGASSTLTISAISSTNIPAGVTFLVNNESTTPITISSTPTLKNCGASIPVGAATAFLSDGTNLHCSNFGTPPLVTSTLGSSDVQSGTTYTFVATDCGKTILFTSNSAVTATIPASIAPVSGQTCIFTPIQGGTAKVSVNGTAVTAATLVSAHSYTGTSGTQGSAISIDLTTVGGTATAYLLGDGS